MYLKRLELSIETVQQNISILESNDSNEPGAFLQLEHEKLVLFALEKLYHELLLITNKETN